MKIAGRKELTGSPIGAATLESLIVDSATAVRPPERLTVSQSAERYRKINNPGSYVGDWKNDTTPYLIEPMDELQSLDYDGLVFAGPAQCGKALALDTPLATPSGWTTMGGVKPGDRVFGADGRPTTVTATSPIMQNHRCYRVVFDDGTEIVADAEHLWAVEDRRSERRRVATTQWMADQGVRFSGY